MSNQSIPSKSPNVIPQPRTLLFGTEAFCPPLPPNTKIYVTQYGLLTVTGEHIYRHCWWCRELRSFLNEVPETWKCCRCGRKNGKGEPVFHPRFYGEVEE
jgi:hypothetical protein